MVSQDMFHGGLLRQWSLKTGSTVVSYDSGLSRQIPLYNVAYYVQVTNYTQTFVHLYTMISMFRRQKTPNKPRTRIYSRCIGFNLQKIYEFRGVHQMFQILPDFHIFPIKVRLLSGSRIYLITNC